MMVAGIGITTTIRGKAKSLAEAKAKPLAEGKANKDIAAKLEAEVRKAVGLISIEDKAQAAAANAEAAPAAQPKGPAGRK